MWERYYKADPSRKVAKYGESGIGMAIVHQLLQLHHAKVCVDSAPGKGTTFTLLFLARRLQAMAAISRKMTAASLLTDAIEILRQSLFIKRNAGQGADLRLLLLSGIFSILISGEQTAFKKSDEFSRKSTEFVRLFV